MRKLKLERKWARGSWRILARAGGGICRVGRTRGREKERESRLRVAYTGRRKSAGSRQGLGVGRPRLSAIKIIPFLLAAERKELTSTLSRVPPGCYPLPLSSSAGIHFLPSPLQLLLLSSFSFLEPGGGSGKHSYFNCVVLRQDDQPARDGAE